MEKKHLAESDHDRLFLDGFPEPIKSRVLRRLEIKLPDQDPDNAYKHCPKAFAYEQAGKVTQAQDRRITLADRTWIPREVGKTMKESVNSLHQELEKRNANVSGHVTTGLLCLSGPEIETELDIEPSAYLQTSMDESSEAADDTYHHVLKLRAELQAAEAKLKKQGKAV